MLMIVHLGQLPGKRTHTLLIPVHPCLLAYLRKNDKKLAAMIPYVIIIVVTQHRTIRPRI